MFNMFLERVTIDQNIIHVHNDEFIDELWKDSINAFLKSAGAICNAKRKHWPFEMTVSCRDRQFLLTRCRLLRVGRDFSIGNG